MRNRLARPAALVVPLVVVALALGGCSGDDSSNASSGSSGSSGSSSSGSEGSSSSSPYLPVPDGVDLTAQGSNLDLGQDAVVAYEPRQDQVGVLDIKVTSTEKTTFKQSFQGWQLSQETLKTSPYFVHATVENVGKSDLGGRPVPLYIVDGRNTLIEPSTFASTFEPCPSQPFPKTFKHGDRVKACLVYLSPRHGDLTAVSFRPTQEFDPITWTGKLTTVGGEKPAKGGKGSKDKKGSKG